VLTGVALVFYTIARGARTGVLSIDYIVAGAKNSPKADNKKSVQYVRTALDCY